MPHFDRRPVHVEYRNQSWAVIANDVTITYGISPDQMQELTKAAAAGAVGPLADKIVKLSQKLGVTQDATVTFLHILGQQEVPLESLGQKLHEVAEKYKSAMDRLAALDPQDAAAIMQIKIWLLGVSPMVWRRVRVSGSTTLRELHGVIQVAMGWEGIHLYQFSLRAARYGSSELSASSPDVTLAALRLRQGARPHR